MSDPCVSVVDVSVVCVRPMDRCYVSIVCQVHWLVLLMSAFCLSGPLPGVVDVSIVCVITMIISKVQILKKP